MSSAEIGQVCRLSRFYRLEIEQLTVVFLFFQFCLSLERGVYLALCEGEDEREELAEDRPLCPPHIR